jgi:PKD repeat protein
MRVRLKTALPLLATLAFISSCNDDANLPGSPVTATEPTLGVSCSASPSAGRAPLVVSLQASPNVPVVQWSFGDGSGGNGADTTHTYYDGGTFTAVVEVIDGGKEGVCRQTVVVQAAALPATPTPRANRPPNPDTRFDPGKEGTAPFTVTLNACPSYDRDEDPLRFRIDFGDNGGTSSVCRNVHTYTRKGTYRPSVCVSDGQLEACRTYILTVS